MNFIEKYHVDVVHSDPDMKSKKQACCLNALGDCRKNNIRKEKNIVKYFTMYIVYLFVWKMKSLFSKIELNKNFETYCDDSTSFILYL